MKKDIKDPILTNEYLINEKVAYDLAMELDAGKRDKQTTRRQFAKVYSPKTTTAQQKNMKRFLKKIKNLNEEKVKE